MSWSWERKLGFDPILSAFFWIMGSTLRTFPSVTNDSVLTSTRGRGSFFPSQIPMFSIRSTEAGPYCFLSGNFLRIGGATKRGGLDAERLTRIGLMKRVKVVMAFEVQGLWFDWFDPGLLEIGIIFKEWWGWEWSAWSWFTRFTMYDTKQATECGGPGCWLCASWWQEAFEGHDWLANWRFWYWIWNASVFKFQWYSHS